MGIESSTERQFTEAYDRWADSVFKHCYYRCFSRERAKELMQETFMKTWKYLAEGGEVRNLKAFLFRVANNLIIDESRKKKELALEELQEQGFDVTDGLAGAEEILNRITSVEVLTLMQNLPELYRQILVMRYVDDLTPSEIAQILSVSENVVSVRIHRGLKKVKELTHE